MVHAVAIIPTTMLYFLDMTKPITMAIMTPMMKIIAIAGMDYFSAFVVSVW
jgi:hypothetical protein